jgi:nucleotide-binding universal stress UspA family protein
MATSAPHQSRVLVVTDRTPATPAVFEAVRARARCGPAAFHLVVPATPHGLHRVVDPEVAGRDEARQAVAAALPELSAAAGAQVTGAVGDADPLSAIHDAVHLEGFDEIIVGARRTRVARWLRLDLLSKARTLGLPLTVV